MGENSVTAVYYGLYIVAFAASMLAFLMTDIQKLRILIVLSSAAYAIYYYFYPAEPLWLDVGSEIMQIAINGFMILFLIWSHSRIKFDQREQFLYDREFYDMTRVEFNNLLKISEWHLEAEGFVYTVEGEAVNQIYYLITGHAEAKLPDGKTVILPQGNVIGEVSYRLHCPASATVTSIESCMSLRWNQAELRKLCSKNPNIKSAVDNVLSSHMARKLSDSAEDTKHKTPTAEEPG